MNENEKKNLGDILNGEDEGTERPEHPTFDGSDDVPVVFIRADIGEFFVESHDVVKEPEVPVSVESAVSVFAGCSVLVPLLGVSIDDEIESAVELLAVLVSIPRANAYVGLTELFAY